MTPSSSPLPAACLCILLSTMTTQAAGPSVMPHAPSGVALHSGMGVAMNHAKRPYSIDVFRRHLDQRSRSVYFVPGELPAEAASSAERIMQDESVMRFQLPSTVDMVSTRHFTRCVAPKIVQTATVRTSRHLPTVVYGSALPCRIQVARASLKPGHTARAR